jgi:hypothetical protein
MIPSDKMRILEYAIPANLMRLSALFRPLVLLLVGLIVVAAPGCNKEPEQYTPQPAPDNPAAEVAGYYVFAVNPTRTSRVAAPGDPDTDTPGVYIVADGTNNVSVRQSFSGNLTANNVTVTRVGNNYRIRNTTDEEVYLDGQISNTNTGKVVNYTARFSISTWSGSAEKAK